MGVSYTPSTNTTLSDLSFTKTTATANTAQISNVFKVISLSNPWSNFSGALRFTYQNSELNGLNEADLLLTTFNSPNWTAISATTLNTVTNEANATVTALDFTQLSLQISGTLISSSPLPTTPSDSGGGGGGGVTVNTDRDGRRNPQ